VGLGPYCDLIATTATNQQPVAAGDSGAAFTTFQNTVLNVAAPGVLANDADGDSPLGFRARRALIPGVTPNADGSFTVSTAKGGVVVLRPNGSLTYTPKNGFKGSDSFTYRSDDGLWGATTVNLSGVSGPTTVTFDVIKR